MQKIIRVDNKVIVIFEDGSCIERDNVDSALFNEIIEAKSDEDIYKLICSEYKEKIEEYNNIMGIYSKVDNSSILTLKGDSIYWESISNLSLPTELVKAILEAEENGDETLITTYKNFWTLMSLNPDEECRKNLYWFLNKWGLKLSKCGFFVAYRNVVPYKVVDGEEIFTDAHSGTTRIKIGEIVTIPRNECDPNSKVSCSRGLHAGGAGWLEKNYYGSQGIVVLINPSDVTAVPYIDNYGKLRTCAYLPIAKAEFDEDGKVIPIDLENGFDCSYVTKVIYEGMMGTEEDSAYRIEIPELPYIHKETITNNIFDIALKCITERQV